VVRVSECFLNRLAERDGKLFFRDLGCYPQQRIVEQQEPSTDVQPAGAEAVPLRDSAVLNAEELRQLLVAAQGDRRFNGMELPRVTVFNGQTATLDVSDKRYFVTGLAVERKGDQVVAVPKKEAFSTGLQFTVTPAVSADHSAVRLRLQSSFTVVNDTASTSVTTHLACQSEEDGKEHVVPVKQLVQQPTLRTMKEDRSFRVTDGKTVALRLGSEQRTYRRENDACPQILENVPVVSKLFKKTETYSENLTYVLLLTPRIIVSESAEPIALGTIEPLPGAKPPVSSTPLPVPLRTMARAEERILSVPSDMLFYLPSGDWNFHLRVESPPPDSPAFTAFRSLVHEMLEKHMEEQDKRPELVLPFGDW
jgi:hypothetical protein